VRPALTQDPAPLRDVPAPGTLSIFLGRSDVRGPLISPKVRAGDEVRRGQPLATVGSREVAPSPVAGRVAAVRKSPDVRGGKAGFAVAVEPGANGDAAPERRDARTMTLEDARERLRAAGTADLLPQGASTLVVLAADPEPGLSAALRQLVDDPAAVVRASLLAGRLADADRVVLAVLAGHESAVRAEAGGAELTLLPLPAEYPATLPAAVARRAAPAGPPPAVVPLADALAALEAVETGCPPSSRVLTVLGPDGEAVGNFRVPLGTTVAHVLAAAGLRASPGDAVVTGGAFRGLAQYSLDAAVDGGVDALLVLRGEGLPAWTEEPCVNCGDCLDVCPERLPAHLLARFAEFGRFARAAEHGLDDCIECGLCAAVCPARRPMLQRIRLAKREVAAAAAAEAAALAAAVDGRAPVREPDPIAVPVAAGPKE